MAAILALLARIRSWCQRFSATLVPRLRESGDLLRGRARPAREAAQRALMQGRALVRRRLPRPGADVPPGARRFVQIWHQGECWIAVAAFGFIAAILLLDVIGREFVGPALRIVGIDPGATGVFAAQKLSVFALVIGSFAGIGIATATGAHIVPRFAHAWVPAAWGPTMDRLADLLTGLFLLGVAWFGFKFVGSSLKTDLRAPVLDWPVWPIQLFIPLGFLSAAGRYFLFAAWPPLKPAPPEFQE